LATKVSKASHTKDSIAMLEKMRDEADNTAEKASFNMRLKKARNDFLDIAF
jgi:excinuclease UvrABC nuclease subunit